jgi:hypothetical protein
MAKPKDGRYKIVVGDDGRQLFVRFPQIMRQEMGLQKQDVFYAHISKFNDKRVILDLESEQNENISQK